MLAVHVVGVELVLTVHVLGVRLVLAVFVVAVEMVLPGRAGGVRFGVSTWHLMVAWLVLTGHIAELN